MICITKYLELRRVFLTARAKRRAVLKKDWKLFLCIALLRRFDRIDKTKNFGQNDF